jgi:cell division protein FtsZ
MVIGCGGVGSNTIDRLAECGIQGAELYAINTDAQHLLHINADRRFLIGRRTTRGLGAGSLPAIGEEAAVENIDEIKAAVDGAAGLVTCGRGGTGTGSLLSLPRLPRGRRSNSTIVTIPFSAEEAAEWPTPGGRPKEASRVMDTV